MPCVWAYQHDVLIHVKPERHENVWLLFRQNADDMLVPGWVVICWRKEWWIDERKERRQMMSGHAISSRLNGYCFQRPGYWRTYRCSAWGSRRRRTIADEAPVHPCRLRQLQGELKDIFWRYGRCSVHQSSRLQQAYRIEKIAWIMTYM